MEEQLMYKFKTFVRTNRDESATKILVRSESHLILDDTCTVSQLQCVSCLLFRSDKEHGRTVKLIASEI